MLTRTISAVGAAAFLGGCVFTGQLHVMAVGYNEAVARATDSVMLLNILRARDRRPMHFTSISAFRGVLSADASTSLTANIGGEAVTTSRDGVLALTGRTIANGANTFVTGASGKVSIAPSFDLAIHDTQKFYQGILASIDAATIHHFLRQGWRADLVTYLFVEEIRIWDTREEKKGGKRKLVDRFENDPDDKEKAAKFSSLVQCQALSAETKVNGDTPLFSLQELDDISLGDIGLLDGQKFDYAVHGSRETSAPKMVVRKGGPRATLGLAKAEDPRCARGNPARPDAPENGLSALNQAEASSALAQTQFREESGSAFLTTDGYEIEIVLRSIQGIIYFLGEYIRPRSYCPYTVLEADGTPAPLFVAYSERRESNCAAGNGKSDQAVVTVEFDGQRYWIPPADAGAGRSLQVLALTEQLLNLQKLADDRPATQTVRVVP